MPPIKRWHGGHDYVKPPSPKDKNLHRGKDHGFIGGFIGFYCY